MTITCPCHTCGKPASIGTQKGTVYCLTCWRAQLGLHHTKNLHGHVNETGSTS